GARTGSSFLPGQRQSPCHDPVEALAPESATTVVFDANPSAVCPDFEHDRATGEITWTEIARAERLHAGLRPRSADSFTWQITDNLLEELPDASSRSHEVQLPRLVANPDLVLLPVNASPDSGRLGPLGHPRADLAPRWPGRRLPPRRLVPGEAGELATASAPR